MLQPVPNDRLRGARKSKRLSQEKLGEQIGISGFTIGRWERGETLPDAYFVARLSAFFQKRPEELGFSLSTLHMATATPAVFDPAIPLQSTNPLIGREEELAQIKQRLFSGGNLSFTALNGLPGIGKTTLAIALAHDEEVRAHFYDGILWTGLGPNANFPNTCSRWLKLLQITSPDRAVQESSELAAQAIHQAIGNRHMLIVIDDAWTVEDALLLKVGGSNCAHLVTTRFPNVASHLATGGATAIKELNEEDSIALLRQLAPQVVDYETGKVTELVHAVGGLPLALTLVGNYLRLQAYGGQSRRIHSALERLEDAGERLQITAPRGPIERHPSLPTDKPLSLQSIIAVTDQQLDEQARAALYALAIFPAKPTSFSEEAALYVASCNTDSLDMLIDAGLLESTSSDRYTLHQTIADYALAHLQDEQPYDRLLTYITTSIDNHHTDYEELEKESSIILAALDIAYARKKLAPLVQNVNAFAPFLILRGRYALAERHVQRAHEAALALNNLSALSTTLLYQGQLAQKQGQLAAAEHFFQQGLALAQQSGNEERVCALLSELGSLSWKRGEYSRASSFAQEGLALARRLNHHKHISTLLKTLGSISASQGDYKQSERYLREGLELAQQSGDREQVCRALLNLGVTIAEQGNDMQARDYLKDGLTLARQIGHREMTCILLLNLASMAVDQQEFAQAETYLLEGLEMARQINHREWISIILLNFAEMTTRQGRFTHTEGYLKESLSLAQPIGRPRVICFGLYEYGNLYLAQQLIEQAEHSFHEMLTTIPDGDRELIGLANYGLARVAAARGDKKLAHTLATTSVNSFDNMGHRRAREIKQWLQTLQEVSPEAR